MEYEALVRLAREVAACASKARILGQDEAAFDLVRAGDALEDAARRVREQAIARDLAVEEAAAD